MEDEELARKNNRLGLVLFVVAALLVAITIGLSYLYNAVD
jgi:hypothetical protein